jgi:hypothetical protein
LDGDGLICGVALTNDTETVGEDLVTEVEGLVTEEVLNSGQGNSLFKQLDQAQKKADKGQYHAAINIAITFIDHVNDLVAEGTLTPEEAAPLIERAQILIELWSNMVSWTS